jgi:hypothetical protein
MDQKLREFLQLVPNASWRRPPPVWNTQLREAISAGYVKVGFGGGLQLSDTGRVALSQTNGMRETGGNNG